ncbi:MAG: hypothetical protein A2741_01535 [Candidatus Zambryskibacteria bacterium RIFCSPHIGHO2_01_FULL_43_27]|nr:MAG: hypothetical protein A2741_01535 [Candidatus Zambryskibacteria bacterium RIFCSPHIGHO2_01_FULL_43_27]
MYYVIYGKVIKGDGYGKKIGYPTINITRTFFSKLKRKPNFGIYTGRVFLMRKVYKAGIIIGPKDKKGLPKLEAHLIGFEGSAQGRKAIFEVGEFIRKYKKFSNEKELIKQIEKDLKKC